MNFGHSYSGRASRGGGGGGGGGRGGGGSGWAFLGQEFERRLQLVLCGTLEVVGVGYALGFTGVMALVFGTRFTHVPGVVGACAVQAFCCDLDHLLVFHCAGPRGVFAGAYSTGLPPEAVYLVVTKFFTFETSQGFQRPWVYLEGTKQPHCKAVWHLSPAGYFDL